MKKRILCLLTALCICMGFTACGQTPASSGNQPAGSKAESQASSEAAAESKTPEKLSGKVTVYMPSPAGLADKLAAAFTEQTGVEVEQFQGTTGEILARLEAEKANPVADVVILASWSDGLSMKADGQLESYTPAHADQINTGWIDSDHTLFGYSASAVGVIYNTTVVPELNADWAELADDKYKDMIAIPDPEKSGACKDFLAGLVTGLDNGEAIMQSWADNGLTVPGANKAVLEAVTTGEKGILIAGVDYNAYSSMKKGRAAQNLLPSIRHCGQSAPGHDSENGAQQRQCKGVCGFPVQRRGTKVSCGCLSAARPQRCHLRKPHQSGRYSAALRQLGQNDGRCLRHGSQAQQPLQVMQAEGI